MNELFVFLVAFFAAAFGSVLGIGGGIFFVPFSTMFLSFPPSKAVPVSLAMVFTNAVSATFTRFRQESLQIGPNAWLGIAAIPSTLLGSLIGARLEAQTFRLLFSLFVISAAVFVFVKRPTVSIETRQKGRLARKLAVVVAAGFVSTLLGVGGGLIMVPAFIIWAKLDSHQSVGTSQYVTAFATSTGLISYTVQGYSEPFLFVLASVGGFLGGMVGSRIELRLSEKNLRKVIVVAFLAIGSCMIYSAL
ncbi:MAG: sulfite exporter TauE/SafE family protein [Candidatus Caldarchaeum sp.]